MFDQVDISVFLATQNSDECRQFYTEVIGLNVCEEDDFAMVFDLKGVVLRISKVRSFVPHPFTVLGWQVDSLENAMRVLKERGVAFTMFDGMGQDDNGIWTTPDGLAQIAWFKDPDDNVLSISKRLG